MAFGPALGYGLMQPGGSFGGPLSAQRARDPRLAMAQALMREGLDTSPIASPWQGASRMAQAGLSGYLMHKQNEDWTKREGDMSKAYADAIKAMQGTPEQSRMSDDQSLYGGAGPEKTITQAAVPGDMNRALSIMSANPDLAPQAMQFGMQQQQTQQGQNFQREMAGVQHAYNVASGDLQRAHAEHMQKNSQESAAALQAAQQRFQGAENAAQRLFTAGQQTNAQNFTAGENALNRGVTLAGQQASRIPAGYQPNPNQPGALQPIPGTKQATEAGDDARGKAESLVQTDRMIRSAQDLLKHPGLTSAVGFQVGQKYIPGTDAATFDAELETLKSQAFLPMVAQLKGMGQLSDAEGKKLTAAVGALDTKMSEAAFKKSMETIIADLQAARGRLGAPAGSTVPPSAGNAGMPALPPGFTVIP
jgi:hypothetical protein